MNEKGDWLTFLGTAGARVMVASQILASGGLWLDLAGTEILLDPGPGTLVQAAKRKLRASRLEAIILSHRHLRDNRVEPEARFYLRLLVWGLIDFLQREIPIGLESIHAAGKQPHAHLL